MTYPSCSGNAVASTPPAKFLDTKEEFMSNSLDSDTPGTLAYAIKHNLPRRASQNGPWPALTESEKQEECLRLASRYGNETTQYIVRCGGNGNWI